MAKAIIVTSRRHAVPLKSDEYSRPNNLAAVRFFEDIFTPLSWAEGYVVIRKSEFYKYIAAQQHFSPVSLPFGVRVGVRVRAIK